MSKKNPKKKRRKLPVPKSSQGPLDRKSTYHRDALISNIFLIVFSALYMLGLFLPYLTPDAIETGGKIYKGGHITAMELFFFPMVYLGVMSLICVLSILSIILKKSFSQNIIVCILICIPEFAYYLVLDNLLKGGFSLFGSGFYILLLAFFGLIIFAIINELNERIGRG